MRALFTTIVGYHNVACVRDHIGCTKIATQAASPFVSPAYRLGGVVESFHQLACTHIQAESAIVAARCAFLPVSVKILSGRARVRYRASAIRQDEAVACAITVGNRAVNIGACGYISPRTCRHEQSMKERFACIIALHSNKHQANRSQQHKEQYP